MTPWGVVQSIEHIVEGIVFVDTPSHGGLWLSRRRAAALPDGYQPFTCPETRQWAEEDIDAPMVACFFWLPNSDPDHCQRIADHMGERTRSNWQALKPKPTYTVRATEAGYTVWHEPENCDAQRWGIPSMMLESVDVTDRDNVQRIAVELNRLFPHQDEDVPMPKPILADSDRETITLPNGRTVSVRS